MSALMKVTDFFSKYSQGKRARNSIYDNIMQTLEWDQSSPILVRMHIPVAGEPQGEPIFDNYLELDSIFIDKEELGNPALKFWTTAGIGISLIWREGSEESFFVEIVDGDWYSKIIGDANTVNVHKAERDTLLTYEQIVSTFEALKINETADIVLKESPHAPARIKIRGTRLRDYGGDFTTQGTFLGLTESINKTMEYAFSHGTLTVKKGRNETYAPAIVTWKPHTGSMYEKLTKLSRIHVVSEVRTS